MTAPVPAGPGRPGTQTAGTLVMHAEAFEQIINFGACSFRELCPRRALGFGCDGTTTAQDVLPDREAEARLLLITQ